MSPETNTCPNCNTALKDSILGAVRLLPQEKTNIINEYSDTKADGYCNKCGNDKYEQNFAQYNKELTTLRNSLQKLIGYIPVITTHSPFKWEYEILGMVTGQSVTGTGVFSEFTSSFSDLLGMQSNRYNQKLKNGELLCSTQLRKQTLDMGGNAIIATDIDYSEVGGDKGMLLVCMAGTAVKITNLNVLGNNKIQALQKLAELNNREQYLRMLIKSSENQ